MTGQSEGIPTELRELAELNPGLSVRQLRVLWAGEISDAAQDDALYGPARACQHCGEPVRWDNDGAYWWSQESGDCCPDAVYHLPADAS